MLCPATERVVLPSNPDGVRPPPGLPRWSVGFCTREAALVRPPPPGLPRWSEGFCTRGAAPAYPSPPPPGQARWGVEARKPSLVQKPTLHRGKPGGGRTQSLAAPTGLAPVERGLLHQRGGSRLPKPPSTGASPVGGSRRASRLFCNDTASTGASPVGAGRNP